MKKSLKKHIVRDNKLALYVHLDKNKVYIYLPENTEIKKDEKGFFIKLELKK